MTVEAVSEAAGTPHRRTPGGRQRGRAHRWRDRDRRGRATAGGGPSSAGRFEAEDLETPASGARDQGERAREDGLRPVLGRSRKPGRRDGRRTGLVDRLALAGPDRRGGSSRLSSCGRPSRSCGSRRRNGEQRMHDTSRGSRWRGDGHELRVHGC
jgi:hypothetical protein